MHVLEYDQGVFRAGRSVFSDRAWILLVQIFFILMLVLPTSFQVPRGILLVMLASVAVIVSLRIWRVHRDILLIWLMTMGVGVFGVIWGWIHSAPGALKVSTVYLIWPAIYLLFIGLAHDLRVIHSLTSALLLGITLATALALVVMLAGVLGLGGLVYPFLEFQGAAFGNHEGFIEFRTYGLNTVMYGFPFVLAVILVRRDELHRIRKVFLVFLLLSIAVVGLGSGRRAFWLVMVLTPFIILPFLQASACRLAVVPLMALGFKFAILASLILTGTILALGLDPLALIEGFVSAFEGEEASSGARFEQAASLWRAFTGSPIVGQGLGSVADVIRSAEQPWAYELSYLALLMNVGLVGFLLYSLAISWIGLKGLKLSVADQEFAKLFVPLISALCAFLIMNATNPYLSKFDYLWVIFLPVALINAFLTKRTPND